MPRVSTHTQEKSRADRTEDAHAACVDETSQSIVHPKSMRPIEHEKDVTFLKEEHGYSETAIEGSAFRKACAKRSSEEQVDLSTRRTIAEIFSELECTDAEHLECSYARKGIQLVGRATRGLNFTLDLVSPVVCFEPAAACGLAVVKSVVMVCQRFKNRTRTQAFHCRLL